MFNLKGNKLLKEAFRKAGFLCKESLSIRNPFLKKREDKSFHMYVSESVPDFQNAYDSANWYITDLVKEGRC